MKKLQQVSDIINKCVSYIGMVIFIILIVACVAQVFFRFILNNSLSWSEELARYCFIWMHMLGASLLIEGSGHATVTAILDLMHGTLRKIVDIIIELVIFFDGTVMLYAGLKLAYSSRTNLSTALSVPMWCINSSVAVGGILLMFQAFVAIGSYQRQRERRINRYYDTCISSIIWSDAFRHSGCICNPFCRNGISGDNGRKYAGSRTAADLRA